MTGRKNRSKIWVGVLKNNHEIPILLKRYEQEREHYDNSAVFVDKSVSFSDCAKLEIFDCVVKLGEKTAQDVHLTFWDDVTLYNPSKEEVDSVNDEKPDLPVLTHNEAIAIVGISCRLPGANDTSTFWENLISGKDLFSTPPPGRWRSDQGCKPKPEHSSTRAGFLQHPVDTFDSKFWELSPLELYYMDPQARMLLTLAWEALEDAGIPPASIYGTNTAICTGIWKDEYKDLLTASTTSGGDELRRYLGCSFGNAAARVAYTFGTTGPAYAIDTGCSSSSCAIGDAIAALRSGKSNLALAGGVNLLLKPFVYRDYTGVLSHSGLSRAFQADTDGYVRAEGGIIYVLKLVSDAISSGDRIYAILRGFGSSQDGMSRSVGTPTVDSEALAMTLAMKDANIKSTLVDWVEMHGSGTIVGDPKEVSATNKAYSTPKRDRPLFITSVKANIGHTESLSGAAGLLKVVLGIDKGFIPRQPLTAKLNPKLELEGMEIPRQTTPWNGNFVGVSSFGITGTNTHIIVERPQTRNAISTELANEANRMFILPLSAKCPAAMSELKRKHLAALETLDDSLLRAYCYTASTCRTHFKKHRSAVVGTSRSEMIEALKSKHAFEPKATPTGDGAPSLCLLFPGLGCQYEKMGKILYETCPPYRRHFDIVCSLISSKFGIDVKGWVLEGMEGPLYSLLGIFCVEYSLLKMWSSWGISPSFVLGHSTGELAASVASGCVSLPIALALLVKMRSSILDQLKQENTVLADVGKILHSRAMDSAAQQLANEASHLDFSTSFPDVSYISSVEGRILLPSERLDAVYWRRTLCQPSKFVSASASACSQGTQLFLEVGPKTELSSIITKNAPEHLRNGLVCTSSIQKGENDWTTIFESIATLYVNGIDFSWEKIWACFGEVRRIPELVPKYSFQNNGVFWFTPEEPVRSSQIEVIPQRQAVSLNNALVHPLLGTTLRTASLNTTIFTTTTTGLLQAAGDWLVDYKLGPHNIFPPAAYLEMAYAGATFVFPSFRVNGVELSNFEMIAALALEMETEVQTVVEKDGDVCKVTIFGWIENNKEGTWQVLAKTRVSQLVSSSINAHPEFGTEENLASSYPCLSSCGYNFGQSFQTISRLCKARTGDITCDVKISKNADGYLTHPTILDALIQATELKHPPTTNLKFPSSISSITIRPLIGGELKIIARSEKAQLFELQHDGSWSLRISLHNLQKVKININVLQSIFPLGTDEQTMVPLYIEEWRETAPIKDLGEMRSKSMLFATSNVQPFSLEPKESVDLGRVYAFISMGIVSTFYDLGWRYPVGSRLTAKEIMADLKIIPTLSPHFFSRLLHYAGTAGFLRRISNCEWEVVENFAECIFHQQKVNMNLEDRVLHEEWDFSTFYIDKLGVLLCGTESVLPHLFPAPGKQDAFSAERIYSTTVQCSGVVMNLKAVFSCLTTTLRSGDKPRILEVGAGTGSATRQLLKLLENSGATYTFTDVSPAFLNKAETLLTKVDGVEVEFDVLDLEKDPISQGFAIGRYDAIVALNVLHATVNVEQVCRNLRSLLKPCGHLLIAEQLVPSALIDIVFGHCEGYWRFDDNHRTDHSLVDSEKWKKLLGCAGFVETKVVESESIGVGVIIATNGAESLLGNWVLLGDNTSKLVTGLNQQLNVASPGSFISLTEKITKGEIQKASQLIYCFRDDFTPGDPSFRSTISSFLLFAQSITEGKLLLISHGLAAISDEGVRFLGEGPIRGFARTLANEISNLEVTWLDLDPTESESCRLTQIMAELKSGRRENPFVAYREGTRHTLKLTEMKAERELVTPEGNIQLKWPSSHPITDIEWELTPNNANNLELNNVEIRVNASSINFVEVKPTEESANTMQSNFSGEIISVGSSVTQWKLGDRVIGMNRSSNSLSNYVRINASTVTRLPASLTYIEGATLPTAFYTAYHGLITTGKLKRGESVLIHTASTEVGLAAIQIALNLGATIICTAQSRRQRAYLKSLGPNIVLNIKNVSFEQDVLDATQNTGVDLVLNLQTSKRWTETSLAVTKQGGRFMEMSKLDTWTKQEVALLRPDVLYSVEDSWIENVQNLAIELDKWLSDGRLKPIAYTVYDTSAVISALEHLKNPHNIGNIVIRWSKSLFNTESSYLITGGCGKMGLILTKFMLSSGAKHIILVSRRKGSIDSELIQLREQHSLNITNVVVKEADVGNAAEVLKLISDINKNGPLLRGIFHCAGIQSDGAILTMTMAKMETTFAGKVDGAFNLHSATRHLNLEYFVLFSSASWILGSPEQANFSSANAAIAYLADYRHQLGLNATCISWGLWEEVGFERHAFGLEPFSISRGVQTLEYLLRNCSIIGNNVVAAELSADTHTGWLQHYIEQPNQDNAIKVQNNKIEDTSKTLEDTSKMLDEEIRSMIAKFLRVRGELECQTELKALGMDSLMFVELKNKLETDYGVSLEVPETATVDDVVAMVTTEKAKS